LETWYGAWGIEISSSLVDNPQLPFISSLSQRRNNTNKTEYKTFEENVFQAILNKKTETKRWNDTRIRGYQPQYIHSPHCLMKKDFRSINQHFAKQTVWEKKKKRF
jgi:hypothetical protein